MIDKILWRVAFGLLLGLTVLFGVSPVWAQWGRGYDGWSPGMMMGGWGFGGGIFMIVFWILIIVGLVVLIRWLVVSSRSGHGMPGLGGQPGANRALDILKERFARGEINKDEFEERKRTLESN